ncbi:hypothetical protein HPB49_026220 [Dermacentor silvarum]|nr:hypothetical protein HPB49_026220 [Dermacentor silvarum]
MVHLLRNFLQQEAYKQRVTELEAVTKKRAEQQRHRDNLRKARLNEFMKGFGIINSKLKETYQMLTLEVMQSSSG